MAGERFDLGVLFVHGIGAQRSGETLVHWGDTLLKMVRPATRDLVTASVTHASADGERRNTCAEVTLTYGNSRERWLVSEAWWADAFPAPSYSELVSWSVRAIPWALALHIATWHWQRQTTGWRRAAASLAAMFQLTVFLALSPLLVVVLGLTLLFGLLPIPQLRTLILSAQSTLTATIGDSLAFVESPLRAALIRQRIRTRLRRLKARCDHTIVVAHSQGAAAAFDTLGGIVDVATGRLTDDDARLAEEAPDTLVTFGAGTNQLASQLRLAAGMPQEVGFDPPTLATAALSVVWMVMAYVWYELSAGRVSPAQLGYAFGYNVIWFGLLAAVTYGIVRAMKRVSRRWPARKATATRTQTVLLTVWLLAAFVGGRLLADRLALPIGVILVISVSAVVVAGALKIMLSPGMQRFLSLPVRMPPGVRRWLDVYALVDPVPHGRTRVDEASLQTPTGEPRVYEDSWIANEGSMVRDHSTYWSNIDGFVLRVLRTCAQTAGSPWVNELAPDDDAVDLRAAWRVTVLRVARWVTYATWMTAGVLLARNYARIPFPFDLPRWMPLPIIQMALYAGMVGAGAWLSTRGIHALWAWWTRSDQMANLRQAPFDVTAFWGLVLVAMPVWMLLVIAWSVTARGGEPARELFDDVTLFLAFPGGLAFVSAAVFRWLYPAPAR